MVTIKQVMFWLVPFVTVLCMSHVETAEWKASERVCYHHGYRGSYADVDFEGCKAACEAETMYTCRSVRYDAEAKVCWGATEIKACYDSQWFRSRDCQTHEMENGYKNMEFTEIVRTNEGCKKDQFVCPCTINNRGDDLGSSQHGGHPRCQSKYDICDGYANCYGSNDDDEQLSICPQEVINQAEEGHADCIDADNGGADYRGNISVSAAGDECMDWFAASASIKEQVVDKTPKTLQEYLNHQNFKGEHNFCRNKWWEWHAQKLQPSPTCFVKSVGTPVEVPCSIPTCKEKKYFNYWSTLEIAYQGSKDHIVENRGSSYNYFIQTEGCELSLDDWWKNIADCKKFNPGDRFGMCPYGVCEQDSDWHKCIKSSCKLPKITSRGSHLQTTLQGSQEKTVVDLIRTRYATCSICSSYCSASSITKCVADKSKEDLATPNGKWAQCVNALFTPMSRCGIPKYWSFPDIED